MRNRLPAIHPVCYNTHVPNDAYGVSLQVVQGPTPVSLAPVSLAIDEKYMREALAEAEIASTLGEVPIGAVVVRGDEILGRGHNMRETWHDPTAHAEVIAIRAASNSQHAWRLTGCTLYVTIEPCAMCAGALVLSRVDRLVYGAVDPKAGAVTSLYNVTSDARLNHQMLVTSGVLEQECGDYMRQFFRRLRQRSTTYLQRVSLPEEPV